MIDPEQFAEARQQARRGTNSGRATTGTPSEIGPHTGSCALTPERCRRWLARFRSDRHSPERIGADEGLPAALIIEGIDRARNAAESRPQSHPLQDAKANGGRVLSGDGARGLFLPQPTIDA